MQIVPYERLTITPSCAIRVANLALAYDVKDRNGRVTLLMTSDSRDTLKPVQTSIASFRCGVVRLPPPRRFLFSLTFDFPDRKPSLRDSPWKRWRVSVWVKRQNVCHSYPSSYSILTMTKLQCCWSLRVFFPCVVLGMVLTRINLRSCRWWGWRGATREYQLLSAADSAKHAGY